MSEMQKMAVDWGLKPWARAVWWHLRVLCGVLVSFPKAVAFSWSVRGWEGTKFVHRGDNAEDQPND